MIPEAAMLDASVTLRFLVDHADAEQPAADALRLSIDRGTTRGHVVDLCIYEMINVMTRRWQLDAGVIELMITEFLQLDIPLVRLEPSLARRTARIAVRSGLSSYDAAHVAAAQIVGVPLITADDRITKAVPETAVSLRAIA